MENHLILERDDAIATVVLNRPDRHNAFTKAMWRDLGEVFETLSADDGVRCIIVYGAGKKAFASGSDIAEFATERATPEKARESGRIVDGAMKKVLDCRHPVIAMIRGFCIGGGLELAAMCDIRICSEFSRFGIPSNRLGLFLSHQYIGRVAAIVGRARALELLLEGSIFGAARAEAIGLVNRVVRDEALMDEAYATARRIAEGAPLSLRWSKQVVRRLADPTPLSEAETEACYDYVETEDYRLGTQAFMEKKTPTFVGR